MLSFHSIFYSHQSGTSADILRVGGSLFLLQRLESLEYLTQSTVHSEDHH